MKYLVMLCSFAIIASAGLAQAESIATYPDFTGYKIRAGTSGTSTTGVTSDNGTQTFTVTAVGGGKVAIGTSVMNGLKVSDFVNFKFSNSVPVTVASQIVYPNFWVTDGTANHYALVAVEAINGQTQDDFPVYNQMISSGGMGESYFDNLGVRCMRLTPAILIGCIRAPCEWRNSAAGRNLCGNPPAPRLSTQSVFRTLATCSSARRLLRRRCPGINANPVWSYVGTGDPQIPDTFYLMCGDTSGSVQNFNYTLGNIELQYVPEPGTLVLLGLGGLTALGAMWIRRRQKVAE